MTKITEFKSWTGRTVSITSETVTGVELEVTGLGATTKLGLRDVETLREFFQSDRDEELGRWRSNRNPNLVVYPLGSPGEVTVLDERDGMKQWVTQLSAHGALQEFADVAKEYFDAHPGKKPWHDAKPGEAWVLTVDGHDDMLMVAHESKYGGYRFYLNDREGTVFALDTPSIRAGRRIWPETKEN